VCRLFAGEQVGPEFLLPEKLACSCLSRELHSGGFSKKLVNEVKKDGLHWVCSIPGMSPYWPSQSSVVHTEPEAE